jgi:mannose-6-phosphate isomerase-like protein (cupin superfamily)
MRRVVRPGVITMWGIVVSVVLLARADVVVQEANAGVQFVPASKVRAALEQGGSLLDDPAYKVLVSRRDKPGEAEVHERDTDIFYVLTGTATIVTGGTVVNGKTTEAGEIRGPSIEGGDARPLADDDMLVIPRGTPHQFTKVSAPFVYYVIKVTAPETAAE